MGGVSRRATFWWGVVCYKWREKPQKKGHPLVVVEEEVRGVCSTWPSSIEEGCVISG